MGRLQLPRNPNRESWISALARLWTNGAALNVLPYKYNCKIGRLEQGQNRQRITWSILFTIYTADCFYLISASKSITLVSVSEEEFINFHVHYISRLLSFILITLSCFNAQNMLDFINLLLKTGKLVRFNNAAEKQFEKVTSLLVTLTFLQPIIPMILHFQARHSLRYWPAMYLTVRMYDNVIFAVLYATLDFILSNLAIYGAMFIILGIPVYINFALVWMSELE